MTFARGTDVPVSRTRGHIEELLTQWQAGTIGIVTEGAPPRATVMFTIPNGAIVGRSAQWAVRMRVPLPTAEEFKKLGKERSAKRAEQAVRERWRALYLALKAKLVSVQTGVETFEEAFLPHLVLKGGSTVWESVRGQLSSGDPLQLPQLPSGK